MKTRPEDCKLLSLGLMLLIYIVSFESVSAYSIMLHDPIFMIHDLVCMFCRSFVYSPFGKYSGYYYKGLLIMSAKKVFRNYMRTSLSICKM